MRLPPFLAAVGLAASLCAGCAGVTAADRRPRGDPVARLAPDTPSPWREDFGDPGLGDLLHQADASALDVKAALARLEHARADVEAADAVRGVNVIAGFEAAVGGRTFHTAGSAGTPTLEVGKDIDLWGRIGHARDAARSDRDAASTDVDGVRLLIGAQTARTYYALVATRSLETLEQRRRDLADRALDLVAQRAVSGSAMGGDIAGRRNALAAASARAQQFHDEGVLQAAQLADLSGGHAAIGAAVPLPPVGLAPGVVSSGVVDARPDVRAAWARLAAADQRRASAIAASRPQFRIAASFGAPDAAIATLLDARALAWAVASSISHEIMDGGARRAKIHAATAEADLAEIAYRQTVLAAWTEIRAALAADAQARRDFLAAQARVAAAEAAVHVGLSRHENGAADGMMVVDLQDAAVQGSQGLVEARRRLAEARIRLVLARGGA
jgi:outer membrane protein TolC